MICILSGMEANAELQEFVKKAFGRGHADSDLESIMRVLTANRVKVGSCLGRLT